MTIERRPAHGITVADVNRVYYGDDPDVAKQLRAPELATHWQKWARHRPVWHLDEEKRDRV